MCIGVIRFVDAKYSPNLSIRSFTGIDFSLSFSLESTCTTVPKLPERRNGRESCEELGHTIVLGLPSFHPNTSMQRFSHCYLLEGSGEGCGDKFGSAPAGLVLRRRGAPERRNGTKRQGSPYHVCTGVIRVVDDK